MLRLQNKGINVKLARNQKVILQYLISDVEKYDTNSNVLSVLFNLIEILSTQVAEP